MPRPQPPEFRRRAVELADAYVVRVESLRDLLEVHDREIIMIDSRIAARLHDDDGYRAIQVILR